MSKYITHFQTKAAYQAALPTLDLPNVSLVDELNEVHYNRALYGAHAGDICLYDVAEGQKIFVTKDNWNLTDYPTASYPIIGIAVVDESADGLFVMSNFGVTADGSKTTDSNERISWQKTFSMNWGLTKYTSETDAKTDFNGKTNTTAIINAIKAYDTEHSTDNITGCIGGAIQSFVTEGTLAGDWYIGGAGEIFKMDENQTVIKAAADKIYNAGSTLGMNGKSLLPTTFNFLSSSEISEYEVWETHINNDTMSNGRKDSINYVRPFLRV